MRYVLLIIMLFSPSVFAADTTAKVQAKTVIGVRTAQGTAYVKVDTSLLRLPSGTKTFKKIEVPYSVARLREMMKGKLNPAHVAAAAALAAVLDGVDYSIDELTGQIMKVEKKPFSQTGQQFYAVVTPNINFGLTPEAACTQGIRTANGKKYCGPGYNAILSVNCATDPGKTASFCAPGFEVDTHTPATDAQVVDLVMAAFNNLTPAQQRMFFEDLAGNPAISPELAEALQAEADRLKAAEGLESADVENPNGETDTENKPQEVTVTDPIEIDGSEIVTDKLPDDIFNSSGDYSPLTGFLGSLPELPELDLPNFGLDYSSSCRTITFAHNGASVLFPSSAQCDKLKEAKEIVGWFISVITMFGIAWLILGNRKPGV